MQTLGHEGIKQLNDMYDGFNGIEQKLKTNLITDLSNDEIDLSIRIAAFGRNEIPQKSSTTFLCLLFDALKNWTCITLIICGIISFVLSFYHPNGETIKAKIKPIELDQKCNVIRESTIQQIPIKDIVVGDICEIKYGDVLPADGVIIQSNNLKVDESSLTGELDLIEKYESTDPFLLSGTHIIEGSDKMLILAVSEHGQTGTILKLLSTIKEQNNDKKKQNATASQNVVLDNVNPTSNEDDLDCVKIEKRSILHTQLRKLGIQIEYADKNFQIDFI
ncbi:unnamed protein product [Rotaria sordida]|uniref:Cation-transporting P-type ATPase N-terminal domain-containing protein n=1 Tax=Rotaria sordida TaxID=392033 RepID=A0A815RC51_9BILA|nr:unnamed protein product [Rotaria sordida]CAF1646237.1 unnamed protein product [Rotaria sordida]